MDTHFYTFKEIMLGTLLIFIITIIIPIIIILAFFNGNFDYMEYISELVKWTFFLVIILSFFIILIIYRRKILELYNKTYHGILTNLFNILISVIVFICMPIFTTIHLIPLYKDLPVLINEDFLYCEGELMKVTSTSEKETLNYAYICNTEFEISSDLKDSLVPGKTYKVTYLPNSKSLIKFEEK